MNRFPSSGIRGAYRMRRDAPFLQSDVAINAGNSGGPMFDDKGNVVAVVVSGFGEMDSGVNFFIPIDDAFRTLFPAMTCSRKIKNTTPTRAKHISDFLNP